MSGRSIEKVIERVLKGIGLSDPDEIRRISDGEILRCPGVGRKTLSIVRSMYPLDVNLGEPDVSLSSEELLQALMQAQTTGKTDLGPNTGKILEIINLGSIYDVVAAKLNGRILQIQTARLWETVKIGVVWSEIDCAEVKQDDQGFGTITNNELIRPSLVFPKIKNVTKVEFDKTSCHGSFWATTIKIWTNTILYKIELFGDDYLDGMALKDESDVVTIYEEIRNDPEFTNPYNTLFLKWHDVYERIEKSNPIQALEVLRSANKAILELRGIVNKYAKMRNFSLSGEYFVLTGADLKTSENGAFAGVLFSWKEFFPHGETPIDLVGKALRSLLEGNAPFQLTLAKEILAGIQHSIMIGLDDFFQQCEVISNEIEMTLSELQASGLRGILRKDIISGIDTRFSDDGMLRRAVIRWINAHAAKGQIIKVSSAQGMIIRLANFKSY